jgi:hypothetical protein
MTQNLPTWFAKQKPRRRLIIGCSGLFLLCCLCSFPMAFFYSPDSTPDAITVSGTQPVFGTATDSVGFANPTNIPTLVTPQSRCINLRFAEYLGPDTIDEMINEGATFHSVSEITVRFDCPNVTPEQITWEWKRNGELHCTNTFQSSECDQSHLTSWRNSPGNFLIKLFSRGGYLVDLQSGTYELIIYVSGIEAIRGSIEILE